MIALFLIDTSSCDQVTVPFVIVKSSIIPPGTGSKVEAKLSFSPRHNSYINGTFVGCRLLPALS